MDLTNRDVAFLLWLGAAAIALLVWPTGRRSVLGILSALRGKLLVVALIYAAYFGWVVAAGQKLGIWDASRLEQAFLSDGVTREVDGIARTRGDPRALVSAAGSQRGIDLVQVLAAVLTAVGVDRAVRVVRIHPVKRQLRDARVRLLGDAEGELRSLSRRDRVDEWTSRVIQPVAFRLGVVGRPRFTATDLLGEDQDADVPVGDMSEHAGDGPVLVYRRAEGVIVQTFDQRTHALALTGVRIDVRAIASHVAALLVGLLAACTYCTGYIPR
jgi:hypothetical protein